MGILSRFFSKKEVEVLEELDDLFANILKKTQGTYISLVGLKGNTKGLEIISTCHSICAYTPKEIRRFNATLTEYFIRMGNLPLIRDIKDHQPEFIQYFYKESLQFIIIPIPNNDRFMITAMNCESEKFIRVREKIAELVNRIGTEPKS